MPKNHDCSAAKQFLAVYLTDPCVMATRGNSTEFSRHLPIVLFENIIKSNAWGI